jgi:hypothetical protein
MISDRYPPTACDHVTYYLLLPIVPWRQSEFTKYANKPKLYFGSPFLGELIFGQQEPSDAVIINNNKLRTVFDNA